MCSQSYGTCQNRATRRLEVKLKNLYRQHAAVAALIQSLEMYQRLTQGGRNSAVGASR